MLFVLPQHTTKEIFSREKHFIKDEFNGSSHGYSFREDFLQSLRNNKELFVFIHGMGIDGAEMDPDGGDSI